MLLSSAPGAPFDDLSDIAMVGRYEVWRETVVADTTPIASLTDWSGNGNHLSQATSGFQPTILNGAMNGQPVAVFDGIDDFLMSASIPAMNNADSRWYYLAFRYLSYPAPAFPCAMSGDNTAANGTGDLVIYGGVADQILLRFVYASTGDQTTAVNTPAADRLASIVGDGTNVTVKMGPGLASDTNAQATDQPNGTFKLMLGAAIQGAPQLFANLRIAALFMGNTVLTTLEKSRIEAYMLSVYGTAA